MEREHTEPEVAEQVRLWREKLQNPTDELLAISEEMLEIHIELIEQMQAESIQNE